MHGPTGTQPPKHSRRLLRRWLIIAFVLLFAIPVGGFVVTSAGSLIYVYWPTDFTEFEFPAVPRGTRELVVISHGLKDNAATWSQDLATAYRAARPYAEVVTLDWNPYAADTFRCSVAGRRLGAHWAESLAELPNLTSLHLIGHSCGSFVGLGACEELRRRRADVRVQSTYLDPVTVYGGVFWRYGIEHFGTCADFSDTWIDTGDTVPGSNELVPETHTFDVTAFRHAAGYAGLPHLWPTIYYRQRVESGTAPWLAADPDIADKFKPGVLEALRP